MIPQLITNTFLKERRSNGDIAAEKEHERIVSNWIEHQPKWKQSCSKKMFNWNISDKTFLCNHLCGVNVKVLIEYVTEVSGS